MGTGGKSHYEIELPLSNGEVHNDFTYGVLKLTFHPKSCDGTFSPWSAVPSKRPREPRTRLGPRRLYLWMRCRESVVDLVCLKRGCKVRLWAGRGRVSGQGGGKNLPRFAHR